MANKIDQFWEIFKAVSGDTSTTVTAFYGGVFKQHEKLVELQNYIKS